ncbi:MAG: SAM-dependent methyltransferase [bacterium]|nr:MAG: SAM-dependent methyltransferase [bacterium]
MTPPKAEEIIAAEITRDGPIPFARYMEICLYHPEAGYYQRAAPATGRPGDFYTAPHVHALFGHTIAQWIHSQAGRWGMGPVTLLELGPGNGRLARDILDWWGDRSPALAMVLVEGGGRRRAELEEAFLGQPVSVMDEAGLDLLDPFEGFVLANEFFDALPLRVFQKADGALAELFVDLQGRELVELLCESGLPGGAPDEVLSLLPEGFRTEISPQWQVWMERISRVLARGQALILDYGEYTDGLIVPWRMGGTLRCYRGHQVDTDPLEAPGDKDITAHVNFSLLGSWAAQAGLEVRSLVSQASFLVRSGILDLMTREMEALTERQATELWLKVKNLVHDEEGMGELFKAMVLEKGKREREEG